MDDTTIAAVSTPAGSGGIAVIRVSGPEAFRIADKVWRGRGLSGCESHTAHLGEIVYPGGEMLDTAVATLFRAPASYTGEDTVEISVHGSPWIQREALSLLIDAGAVAAGAGEFTRRAFLNGRIDLAQAEGVADMISASSRAAQRIAARQMKGDFSDGLNRLREKMIDLASMLELELDFSEEDVEFADRSRLRELAEEVYRRVGSLEGSFRKGRALKEGVGVVIAGVPNAGKSTLLNTLTGDDRAIVSDIPGTTRDIIEEKVEIGGVLFRFMDTAGLRNADDEIERMGIERARRCMEKADIIIRLIDVTQDISRQRNYLASASEDTEALKIDVYNKSDVLPPAERGEMTEEREEGIDEHRVEDIEEKGDGIRISAKNRDGIERLKERLVATATSGTDVSAELIVTNARHYESLRDARESLERFLTSLNDGLPADLLSQDLRESIHHLSAITGAITSDTLLQTIFSRFCIGK